MPSTERVSTLAVQRRTNPLLGAVDLADFTEELSGELMAYPAYYAQMAPINRVGAPVLGGLPELAELTLEEFDQCRGPSVTVVDTRDRDAFAAGHLPGAVNIELNSGFGSYVGWLLPFGSPLLLVLPEEPERPVEVSADDAVTQLIRIGWPTPLGHLSGGMTTWRQAGREVRSYPSTGVEELCAAVDSGEPARILDVRQPLEWAWGTAPGSETVFLADLPARLAELRRAGAGVGDLLQRPPGRDRRQPAGRRQHPDPVGGQRGRGRTAPAVRRRADRRGGVTSRPALGLSPSGRDVVAGVSVALVLAPQSLAYAQLAGLPPVHGLYAAVAAPIAAALFASSPYLQTGPVAMTSLLTLGALAGVAPLGSAEFAAHAALLALVVGVARIALGLIRAGVIGYLLSAPAVSAFTTGAALLIICSQVPTLARPGRLCGEPARRGRPGAGRSRRVGSGHGGTRVGVIVVIRVARRLNPLVPGVLLATVAALVLVRLVGPIGRPVGSLDLELPPSPADLPWPSLPGLVLSGVVIAVVGFRRAGLDRPALRRRRAPALGPGS